ncbi:MAG: hypothetical protein ACD_80C00077G0006 [uncultured bacterium (gcode 4)]|uniref:Major facilitator superfamily (MFS) profile domain-containing protein n=1 Tax=uncultured bacterium (gcode 4) TaxID=1234023 RepID=K1XJJ6_9BACT|nr:MAG: hypothetical protein ACD_80C00077G0006 [uncultured bacterium (gcode 4)]
MTEKNQKQKTIMGRIQGIFSSILPSIRIVWLSVFVFILWRGLGWDTFFSIYVKSIVDNVFWISIISAILSFSKMFFSITVGEEDDHTNIRSVIILSKLVYVITGVLYFLAGLTGELWLLIAAVICNGFASASLITTYQTFIRKHTTSPTRGRAFWLYFSAGNLAYVVGALIASGLILFIKLHFLFLFISIFAIISLFIDERLPGLSKTKIRELFWKEKFLHKFFREVFSFRPIKQVVVTLKTYSSRMYYALGFEILFNVLNYIGFIFIPIVSIANNLSLSQVAIIFAVMRLPYVIDIFIGDLSGKNSKRKFLFFVLLFMSFLYLLIGYNESFRNVIIITFGISLWLSLMRPVISAYISDCTNPKEEGTISGVGEFVGKVWEIIGVLLFGALSIIFGSIQISFIIIGIIILAISVIGIIKRYNLFQKKWIDIVFPISEPKV